MAPKAEENQLTRHLRREAVVFSRYLIGEKKLPGELIQRYQAFWQKKRAESPEQELIDFACTHSNLIGLLESGSAILAPDHFLRHKLLSMTAILEASPRYTSHFLPDRKPHPFILFQLAWVGARGVLKAILGIFVYLVVTKCYTT